MTSLKNHIHRSIAGIFFLSCYLLTGASAAEDNKVYCDEYANDAISLNLENLVRNCGYAGSRWQSGYDYHYGWCMRADPSSADGENRARQAELARCGIKELPSVSDMSPSPLPLVPNPPGPREYLGCFKDQGDPSGTSGRDLSGFALNNPAMTVDRCVSLCREKGFPYAGAQYSSWCFCGNDYGRSGKATNCDMKCAGNSKQICGGAWANSVYRTGITTSTRPVVTDPSVPGMDYGVDRPFADYKVFKLPKADPALCRDACTSDPACKAWACENPRARDAGPNPTCWLKNAVPNPVQNAWRVSGVKGGVVTPPITPGMEPNLSGAWYLSGDPNKPCSITQSGNTLNFRNEFGSNSAGSFLNATTVVATGWGGLHGTITPDTKRINWANGSWWARGGGPERSGQSCDECAKQKCREACKNTVILLCVAYGNDVCQRCIDANCPH